MDLPPNIHITNPTLLKQKITGIQKDGREHLRVISDFDRTLTQSTHQGKKLPSMIALIRDGNYLTPDYAPQAHALFEHYHPIEIDDTLDHETKAYHMTQRWNTHKQLLIDCGMHERVITDIIDKRSKVLRPGTAAFFGQCHQHDIPLLIFSAGMSHLIQAYLEHNQLLTPNIHILANTLIFDETGHATGYTNQTIHTLNKSENQLTDPRYQQLIAERKNILLLGDSLGDLGMASSQKADTIISIGFLNHHIDTKLTSYKQKFDVVITHDGSFDYVNQLMEQLI